ncbi:MAG: hypothetical protein IKU45_05465 [Clostridia bacterium]|nr:hypothetical protein [Clostridia bacterium]
MKNKTLTGALNILKNSCVIFTVIVFGFYILGNAIESSERVLTLTNMFYLYLFSLWFALSNLILRSKKINAILSVFLHFVSTNLGFFFVFVYLPGNLQNKSRAFILVLCFAFIYILVASVAFGINSVINKKKNENEEYKSVYEDSKE